MMKTFKMASALFLLLAACGDNTTPPVDLEAYQPDALEPLVCVPNLDGRIDANELGAAIGVPVNYRISAAGLDVPVDLAGAKDQAGVRVWDWSAPSNADRAFQTVASDLTDKWYAASFPTGQFATSLDAGGRQEAVYRRDDSGLYLQGFASRDEDGPGGKTLLVYQNEVLLYPFPMEVGDTWVATGEVQNGVFRDLPYAGRDIYNSTINDAGELWLPDVSFENALKITTTLTASPSVGESVTRKQVSFLFECFGEVARATSQDNETNDNFSVASEVRRLGFAP